MKKFLMALFVVTVVGGVAQAGSLMALPQEMQGRYGATHFIDIGEGTFDGMATNVTYTNKYPVLAGSTIRFVAYELKMPFVGAATTNTVLSDATVTFGTENSATAFMAAKQCSTNTPVWWFAGMPAVSVTVADTNATYAGTVTWGTTYAAATNLMVNVIPTTGQSLAWAQRGQLRLFLQKREPYGN